MNYGHPTTEVFPRTARKSGTEYANTIERTRRQPLIDKEGIVIVLGCVAAVVIVYAWLWGSI